MMENEYKLNGDFRLVLLWRFFRFLGMFFSAGYWPLVPYRLCFSHLVLFLVCSKIPGATSIMCERVSVFVASFIAGQFIVNGSSCDE